MTFAFIVFGIAVVLLLVGAITFKAGDAEDSPGLVVVGGLLVVLSFLVWISSLFALSHDLATANDRYITATISSKDTKVAGSSSAIRYYTDKGTFVSHDSMWYTYWTSGDMYGKLEPGHTYRLHVAGYRVGILSWFPNIVSAQRVE